MPIIVSRLRNFALLLLFIGGLFGTSVLPAQDALSQPASVYARPTFDADPIESNSASELPATAPPVKTAQVPVRTPIPLAPPSERKSRELASPRLPNSSTTITTVLSSLAVVLGFFFITAWFLKRNLPKGMALLPGEVLEQLGRAPLAGKQQMYLVRIGHKLLLLVVTPHGAETLTEITDPAEVDRLCGLCRQHGAHGPSAEFRAVLRQFEREPAGPGFLGDTTRSDVELASSGQPNRRPRTRGTAFDA